MCRAILSGRGLGFSSRPSLLSRYPFRDRRQVAAGIGDRREDEPGVLGLGWHTTGAMGCVRATLRHAPVKSVFQGRFSPNLFVNPARPGCCCLGVYRASHSDQWAGQPLVGWCWLTR
jgi:hypothetical protein